MRHGSLFSGIGGFDLAAEWMEWENVFHCEWNEFGKKVLSYYWPNAISYYDITKTDFSIHRGEIDILTGGFPCQPYSSAGKRLGKEDERHLWPEMLRAIREIQPTWVVGENVLGLVNWNGGLVFHEVQTDLEAEGYEVQPYVLPAVSVNAPHRRDRVWFVAYSDRFNRNGSKLDKYTTKRRKQTFGGVGECFQDGNAPDTESQGTRQQPSEDRGWENRRFDNDGEVQYASNTDGIGLRRESDRTGKSGFPSQDGKRSNWSNFPTVSPIYTRNDGFSDRLDLTAISQAKWRNESIKASGNAIVPQVVLEIFKAIEQYDSRTNKI
jgi:DNA (cytosine-5)-methyltransferase 1